jgi:hypothetical protein
VTKAKAESCDCLGNYVSSRGVVTTKAQRWQHWEPSRDTGSEVATPYEQTPEG